MMSLCVSEAYRCSTWVDVARINQSNRFIPRFDRALAHLLLLNKILTITNMISTKDDTRRASILESMKNTLYSCPAAKCNTSNRVNQREWSMPTAQTSNLESLPRPRLPSSLTRLVLPRATHHLTQLGAPYSERERQPYGIRKPWPDIHPALTGPLLGSCLIETLLELSRGLSVCFTKHPRRHAIGRSSAIAIDYFQPPRTSLELLHLDTI